MKVFIALFAIIAVVAADFVVQTGEDLGKYREECVKELEITEDKVAEYKNWQFTAEGKTPCYIRCIFTKMHIFDDEHGPLVRIFH